MRVLSVLPVLGHPRDSKRIAMLQEAGCEVEAVAFERDYHSGRMPACPIHRLGRISHGRYAKRLLSLLGALPKIRRALRRHDIAYASGPDMALSAWVAGLGLGRPVVVEIGDIRRVEVARGPAGWIARRVVKLAVSRSKLLVITARGFSRHFRDRLRTSTPILLLENKLDAPALQGIGPMRAPQAYSLPLTIGYFGVLRCRWSWDVLERLAAAHPRDVRIVVAGHVMEPSDLPERARRLPNVEYRGEYRSPDDLPRLYGDVDIVWACYPSPDVLDVDHRWALAVCRSNRFYESCSFSRPLISVARTGDGDEVARHGIGLVLEDQRPEAVCDSLMRISPEDMARWQANLAALPTSVFRYTSESAALRRAAEAVARGERPPE